MIFYLSQWFLGLAYAADETESVFTITPWPFYIVAIVIGVWVSITLSRMARSGNKRVDVSVGPRARVYDRELEDAIQNKIAPIVTSAEARTQVARTVSAVVSEQMTRKVAEATNDLKIRYETVIAGKDKEQETIYLKYKNVVSEKNQTEAIVQSIAEGLVVVNSRGEVVMLNPAAEKILGVTKKDKIGKSLKENLKDEQLISLVSDPSARGGTEKVVELNTAREETRKIIRSSSALVENENGQTVGMVSVLTDVTKQKELDRLKSQFVSTVSHELRTPIVATQKALAVILEKAAGPLTEDQARFLEIATRNLDRLYNLINDILDFSKLEAGKMRLERAETAIDKVIAEVCDGLNSWARSKEIQVSRKVQEPLPALWIDADRVIQVLNNLIGNALKFTPKGGSVAVEARAVNNGAEVEVSVEDTGVGMTKDELKRVFERFVQLGERRQTDISGTGLGLSIAKEIVELHGGRIWAESEKNKGAKFLFVLPVKKDQRQDG